MDKVIVLIEGYAGAGRNGSYIASPSTVLIESNKKNILVDPGAVSKKRLFAALRKNKVSSAEIDFIFLSHYHPDHFLNIKYFVGLDVYDAGTLWKGDREYFYKGKVPGTEVRILATPGHSSEHCSLLVNTDKGVVCVAADVFWWEDGKQKSDKAEDLLKLKDPFATDEKALLKSRKLLLKEADWIIPGHGKMFKNPMK